MIFILFLAFARAEVVIEFHQMAKDHLSDSYQGAKEFHTKMFISGDNGEVLKSGDKKAVQDDKVTTSQESKSNIGMVLTLFVVP